jgi:hypothetical protein
MSKNPEKRGITHSLLFLKKSKSKREKKKRNRKRKREKGKKENH